MTHKQKLVDALMSDKLVTRKSFKFKVSRRISDLKKDGLVIESVPNFKRDDKKFISYELNYKKSKKALKKYGF